MFFICDVSFFCRGGLSHRWGVDFRTLESFHFAPILSISCLHKQGPPKVLQGLVYHHLLARLFKANYSILLFQHGKVVISTFDDASIPVRRFAAHYFTPNILLCLKLFRYKIISTSESHTIVDGTIQFSDANSGGFCGRPHHRRMERSAFGRHNRKADDRIVERFTFLVPTMGPFLRERHSIFENIKTSPRRKTRRSPFKKVFKTRHNNE